MRFSWRSLIGCLIVVLLSATASAVFVLTQVDQLAGALSLSKSLDIKPTALASSSAGGPQTLLLVGNDQRNHTTTAAVLPHSNEMLLIRLDPSKPWISMMSVPRELLTTIQCPDGAVTTRLNYSLTCGGFKTLLTTIKQVTNLSVNHVVMIDFNNFKRAVNDLGCVYATVDRRYFHVNTPTSAQYQQINLQPGYQRMCGTQALEFVSYRHEDTSLIRDARDQSFLLAVKQEYGPTLIDNIGKFERIFGQTVQTDATLHTSSGLLSLIDTLISSAGLPVRQVQFHVNLQPTNPLAIACACVTASPQQIDASVHSFLYGSLHPANRKTAALASAIAHHSRSVAHLALQAMPAVERSAALAPARRLALPLELPRVQDELGVLTPPDIRDYLIHAPGGAAYPSYVEVFSTGLLGQYYDVQGTTWLTAPIFDSPAQTVRIRGRSYYLWYSGQHLLQVAWYAHHAAYWIRNTLTDAVGNAQMLSIASQTAPVLGADAVGHPRPILHGATTPTFVSSTTDASLQHTIGLLAALVAAAMLPLALVALVIHRRRLWMLRRQVQTAVDHVSWLESRLALAAGAGERAGTSALPAAVAQGLRATATSAAATPAIARPAIATPAAGDWSTTTPAITTPAAGGWSTTTPAITTPAAGGWSTTVIVKHGRDQRLGGFTALKRSLPVVVIAAVIAAAVTAFVLAGERGPHQRRVIRRAPLPTAAVAVLNAGNTQDAAHRLALSLQRHGAHISGVGNLGAAAPPGYEVLYTSGLRGAAARIAQVLQSDRPTVAPIDPTAEAAAGSAARVVVVIP